jgi:alpha-ketoglutarate-dependent taurine dioxygenase
MEETMLTTEKLDQVDVAQVVPLGGRIGAEIKGIQIGGNLSPKAVSLLRAAMLRHKVIFLRDQTADDIEREAFAQLLGVPVPYDFEAPPEGTNYSWEIDYTTEIRSDFWHTDLSFEQSFVDIGILCPLAMSETGGETAWSNTAAAYDELPAPLKAMADQLWAIHSAQIPWALSFPNPTPEQTERQRRFANKVGKTTRHPVVRVHPETGERSLLLGGFLQHFDGFARTTGGHIFELLQYYVTRPENTIRWRWRLGDVAIWDNRSTQHYGVKDYGDQRRVMRRISIKGTTPVGIQGVASSDAA